MTYKTQQTDTASMKLWYKRPAKKWMQALPIGNGRLGAKVFGGAQSERIQLNEESLWAGGPARVSSGKSPGSLERGYGTIPFAIRRFLPDT